MGYNDDGLESEHKNTKSKHAHESTLYCFVFDELAADRELSFRAVDRWQARTRSIRGHVLIRIFFGLI